MKFRELFDTTTYIDSYYLKIVLIGASFLQILLLISGHNLNGNE